MEKPKLFLLTNFQHKKIQIAFPNYSASKMTKLLNLTTYEMEKKFLDYINTWKTILVAFRTSMKTK